MEIRDVIHSSIFIDPLELPIIDSRYFQRLRQIKQLGFAENSFPSATHNRYIHSLGAMETASRMLDAVFNPKGSTQPSPLSQTVFARFRSIVRLAALLHDVGHGPLSHTTEFAMPLVNELKLPSFIPGKSHQEKATHEDYTLKIILDSELTPLLEKVGQVYGFQPRHIAALIEPKLEITDDFFKEQILLPEIRDTETQTGLVSIDFRSILQQIISSEMDADRMDYLRRDSLHAGVSYGQFDFEWLLNNLTAHYNQNKCYLSLQHRALYTFEDFLISRFHMFLMVYFHHKSVIYDEMLAQYLTSPSCEYTLPADIEKYCDYNDAHLYAHLAQSSDKWAQRIVQKRPYQMLIELHSGIPAMKTSQIQQDRLLKDIRLSLQNRDIHYLISTSTSELSKYFRRPGDPLFIHYDNHYSTPCFIPLEQCTDLFQKYNKKRFITRLYVSPENYSRCKEGRSQTPFQDE